MNRNYDYQAQNQAGHVALSASCLLSAVENGAELTDRSMVCIDAAIRDLEAARERYAAERASAPALAAE